ncbi:MAG: VOC family protein [Rhodobacter sp.]|nr:VOC family protein [Rhodobacter sp.]
MAGSVTGIGGVFFRARDPEALAAWYADHLGVTSFGPWPQAEGIAVFAPFGAETDYWPAEKQWMLNLRVEGLDALIDRLQAAGIAVETRPEEWDTAETGRFARITDPEGTPIELWEPPA